MQLSAVSEELAFFTRWTVATVDGNGLIECTQEVQVKGLSDVMRNEFVMYNFANGAFTIDLENQALGRITGKGLINEKVIAWEFRVEEIGFDGFEIYEKEDDKNYSVRAEYATTDQFRTLIQGRVWQQTK